MLIGYACVSSNEQDAAAQVAALKGAGYERIYREQASGGRWDRPELHPLLDHLRKGDVLVVWKLDRLSRSLRDVLTIMERLAESKVGFRSLTEAIDTPAPAGRMMMQIVGAFAEFERAMLRERTRAGLEDRSPGRARWRTTAKADSSTGGRDCADDLPGKKNRCRRCPAVRRPSGYHLAFVIQSARRRQLQALQIADKTLRHLIPEMTLDLGVAQIC